MQRGALGDRLEDGGIDPSELTLWGHPHSATEPVGALHDEVGARHMNYFKMALQLLF